MIVLPNSFSVSLLTFPATFPPLLAASSTSINPCLSPFLVISVDTLSPYIEKINSKSFIWSLKFSLFNPLNFLYSLGIMPKVALEISAVNIAKSFSS